ncbi:MAG: protein-L-isoaspartate O-methyltransferase [Candidatus Pacearchaeota archaeon]
MDKKNLINSLKKKGFSPDIIRAFENSDRSKFISEKYRQSPYSDIPFPIGFNQTTSQPYTIAFMLTLLEIKDKMKILEIGSGSGYVLDLLSEICPNGEIFGVERIKALVNRSAKLLMNKKNIKIIYGDGFRGIESEAPFDRILVSAECDDIPQGLLNQLKIKGHLVVPVRNSIISIKKDSGMNKVQEYPGFSFVPLIKNFNNKKKGGKK